MTEKLNFFIIDDDDDDRELFKIAVDDTASGSTCTSAINGMEALKVLNSDAPNPDYIFLDLNMPKMSGKECLAELKKNEKTRQIPVIMFSTASEPADVEETRKLGALDFFCKPAQISDLTDYLLKLMLKTEKIA